MPDFNLPAYESEKTSDYKMSADDMRYYQEIVDRNLDYVLSKPGVIRFGVGYKMVDGEISNEINLIALVSKKHIQVPESQRIPKFIDGVATDVIGVEQLIIENEAAKEALAKIQRLLGIVPDRNRKFDPVTGGVAIRNRNVGVDNPGVLGAIVFDKSGKAFGLSAQHAIGDQGAGMRARPGDPINQPLTDKPSDEIGKLSRFDKDLDAALFEINSKREYLCKVQGNEDQNQSPFELSEASQARIGQEVECPARRTHSKGRVMYYLTHNARSQSSGRQKRVRTVVIQFASGYAVTRAGDSGAIWVDSKSRSPVANHTGIAPVWLPKKKFVTMAIGTCMEQLSDWGKFSFVRPVVFDLKQQISDYEVTKLAHNDSLMVFCQRPGHAEKILVKEFNRDFKQLEEKEVDLYPKSALAVSKFKNQYYACWRGSSDNIQLAQFVPNSLDINKPSVSGWKTRVKPAMTEYKDRLVIAYFDSLNNQLNVVHCDKYWNWSHFYVNNIKSRLAPAITVFNNRVIVCWSDMDYRMKLVQMDVVSNSPTVTYYDTLGLRKSNHSTALAVIDGKLCLAYTTLIGELRIIETSNLWNWQIRRKEAEQIHSPPSLCEFDGQLLSSRQVTKESSSNHGMRRTRSTHSRRRRSPGKVR